MRWIVIACLALAGLSLLLPSVPSSDAWAWIVWGREVAELDLSTTNGPSWKPLPVLFTTVFSVFGDAAPALWLAAARAGGLLAVVMTYRLAARFAGRAAGLVAVALLLAADALRYTAHGEAEPLVAGLVLWAVERHLDGRPGQAFSLAFLAALGRPEAWPFFGLYAAWLWAREPRLRPLVGALAIALALLWVGADWWGSGNPLQAGASANRITPSSLADADRPALAVALRAAGLVVFPAQLLALGAVVLALRRGRGAGASGSADRAPAGATLALAAGAATWVLLVAVETEAGFTGNERYLFPVEAVLCLLAGVGAVWLIGAGSGPRSLAVGAALLALALPFAAPRARALAAQLAAAEDRVQAERGLDQAVRLAGGPAGVLACGNPALTRGGFQGALAWELGVSLARVERPFPPVRDLEVRLPGVVFSAPATRADPGGSSWMKRPGLAIRRLGAAPPWTVYAVASAEPGKASGCAPAVRAAPPTRRRAALDHAQIGWRPP